MGRKFFVAFLLNASSIASMNSIRGTEHELPILITRNGAIEDLLSILEYFVISLALLVGIAATSNSIALIKSDKSKISSPVPLL